MNMLDANCVQCNKLILINCKEKHNKKAYYCTECRTINEREEKLHYAIQDLGDVEPTQVDLYLEHRYND